MHLYFRTRLGLWAAMAAFSGGLVLPLPAYPPAPHHLFYGLVRDEMGNPLKVDSAEIQLETAVGTQVKGQVIPGLEPGVNYKLTVPMDAGITDDLYQPTALRPTVPFKLKVRIGTVIYLPIEMKGDYSRLGQPGQRTRLDLTLGEDANGNGLPDAWERALLAQSTGATSPIRPEDDFDGDGLSNMAEYIAGTYAFDKQDGFTLKILGTSGESAQLEFLVIRGRTYTVYGSADFQQWTVLPFRIPAEGAAAAALPHYYAQDVRVIRVEVVPPPAQPPLRFFKLQVQ